MTHSQTLSWHIGSYQFQFGIKRDTWEKVRVFDRIFHKYKYRDDLDCVKLQTNAFYYVLLVTALFLRQVRAIKFQCCSSCIGLVINMLIKVCKMLLQIRRIQHKFIRDCTTHSKQPKAIKPWKLGKWKIHFQKVQNDASITLDFHMFLTKFFTSNGFKKFLTQFFFTL